MASLYSGENGAEFLSASHIRFGRILFQVGCCITLLYFPSGLMHAIFGNGVYFRDVLMLLHLSACLAWLVWTGKSALFWRRTWFLVVPAVFILPTLGYATYRVEGLAFIKWTVCWVDWIILGQLARLVLTGFGMPLPVFLGCAVLFLVADAGAGLYEAQTHAYILHETEGQTSAFGVQVAKEANLRGHLRVKGLQRDVFSYSNLMGMSVVTGLLVFVTQGELAMQVTSIVWVLGFSICLFESGGRSAFFGVFAAMLVTGALQTVPVRTRRSYGMIVAVWLAFALLISTIGVGSLTESVGGSVMNGSDIGDSGSAYMRDANWKGITEAIKELPIVLISGAPFASLFNSVIDPIYHWADNQYFWLLYHTSVFGLISVIAYFVCVMRLPPVPGSEWARDGSVIFLLFVMGEGIARESMTFLGCLPLFLMCGWQTALSSGVPESGLRSFTRRPAFTERSASGGRSPLRQRFAAGEKPLPVQGPVSPKRVSSADGSSGNRDRGSSKPRSEAEEFARRVRSAAQRRGKE
jgi:hypothetical protein